MENNRDLISRALAIQVIRDCIHDHREGADRAYVARIREEDIALLQKLPAAQLSFERMVGVYKRGRHERD